MNDDFLYTRQEEPAPEFVAGLRESLAALDVPEKTKRKNGQRRFPLRAIAALFVLVIAGTIFSLAQYQKPQAATNLANESLIASQSLIGYVVPEIPNYRLVSIFSVAYQTHVNLGWIPEYGDCRISLDVSKNPLSPENLQNNHEYNLVIDERSDSIEIIPLGRDVESVWRFLKSYDEEPDQMSLSWHSNDVDYVLQTPVRCFSREEFAAIAESTLPNTP